MASQALTLGQLLDHEELRLRLIAGDEACLGRVVHGVHGTEVEHPTRWLEPGWVMLTTGMRLQDDRDAGRELVAELAHANLAALGFGTGMTFDAIPEPIVDEASRRGFPLFEVPLATRFNEVISFAARSSLSRDFHVLRRTVSMQNYLIESLSASSPEEELIQRLGAVLDSDIALYRPDGELETVVRRGQAPSPGAVPAWGSDVWQAICERPPTPQHFNLGKSRVVSSPVEAEGRIRYWLVVVSRSQHASERLAQPVVEAAGRLLAVIANARRISVSEEREIRRLFIEELTSGAPAQLDQLGQRAAGLGLDFREPARAVQIVVPPPVAQEIQWRPEARLERALALTHQRFVIGTRDDRIICLVQGTDELLRTALDETEPLFGGAVIGVGRAARSVRELAHSVQDSTVAIAQLASTAADTTMLWFDDFDVLACLMAGAPKDVTRARVDQLLLPVKTKPQLYDTLQCWLALDLDVGRSADALHLHPNSMRYRLNRIEETLGRSLRRPATIANLVVATMFDEMHRDDAGPPQTIVRPPST
jgi:purine catabolism regulator